MDRTLERGECRHPLMERRGELLAYLDVEVFKIIHICEEKCLLNDTVYSPKAQIASAICARRA